MDPSLAALLLSPAVLALFGLAIGSFLNVVIHRLPLIMEREWWREIADQLRDPAAWGRTFPGSSSQTSAGDAIDAELSKLKPLGLAMPRSRCPSCGHRLAWHENVPLVGWLRLRGRCSACGVRISMRYPLVEAATGLLFASFGWMFGPTMTTVTWCIASALLVAMTMIDLDTQFLPDDLTLPLLGLGLFAAGMNWTHVSMSDSAWGALAGYLSLWVVYRLYKLVTGKEGMGHGDFKLLAALGALLGWKLLPAVVLLSSVVGALVGIGLMAARNLGWDKPIPFGPYLAGGGLAAAFFGGPLTNLYFPAG